MRGIGFLSTIVSLFTPMATTSRTLTALTRKNMEFKWTVGCEAAFNEIKQ